LELKEGGNSCQARYFIFGDFVDYVTGSEMRELERKSGLSAAQLMENAGKAVAEEVPGDRGKILVICGTGNNGGDGLVAARYLKECDVFLLGEPGTEESGENLKKLDTYIFRDLGELYNKIGKAGVIVDALLGTGVRGKLREPVRTIVQKINESKSYVVSIDVPSGLNADSGVAEDIEVGADLIVSLYRPKRGLEGRNNVLVKRIGKGGL
jgi:hydroxyethylthiazole kinase-like uncharacterized protein yjeF